MRIFIGIPIPADVRRMVRLAVRTLEPAIAGGRLSDWEGYHITLRFLGDVPEETASRVHGVLWESELLTPPFELAVSDLGRFAKRGGDVLWVGLTQPPALTGLYREVERLVVQAGFDHEARDYAPHLTVGRSVRYRTGFEDACLRWKLEPTAFAVSQVILYKSERIDGRLMYVPLLTRTLKAW